MCLVRFNLICTVIIQLVLEIGCSVATEISTAVSSRSASFGNKSKLSDMAYVKFRRFNLKILAVIFALSMVLLYDPNAGMCLDDSYVKNLELHSVKYPRLELANILLADLSDSKNIFFLETAHSLNIRNDDVSLTNRQACSIESAALLNPDNQISVIFVTHSRLIFTEIIEALMKYSNIVFYRLDLLEFSLNTPLEDWIKTKVLYDTKFLMETISDIVRLQLFWR